MQQRIKWSTAFCIIYLSIECERVHHFECNTKLGKLHNGLKVSLRREWFESPGWESDHHCAMTIPLFFCPKSLSSLAREIRPCHCVCGIYLICIIMETVLFMTKSHKWCGIFDITFLHAERGRLQCKCSWSRLNSFPFYHSGREEIMWKVFNYLHALSWFKITRGCVSYILILVNSLIFLPHVINRLTEPHN